MLTTFPSPRRNYKLYLTVATLILVPVASAHYLMTKVVTYNGDAYYTFAIDFRLAVFLSTAARVAKAMVPALITLGLTVRVWVATRRQSSEGVS